MMKGSIKEQAMETNELPKIHLPGEEKFQSYKTSLQEYCHKKKFPAPQYVIEKESDGLVGTVSFSCSYVKCEEKSGSVKEADARAAFEALKQLGYLQGQKYEVLNNQLKRKGDNIETNAKQIKPGTIIPITPKGLLNQIAQKKQLSPPVYDTNDVPGGFFSTVTINNTQYKSTSVHKSKKDAEHDASQVAVNAMGGPLPPTKVKSSGTPAVQPVGLKNRLQEYCQKSSKALPQYDTTHNKADKTYQTKVVIDGIQYLGSSEKAKKTAESSAAATALKSLGLSV